MQRPSKRVPILAGIGAAGVAGAAALAFAVSPAQADPTPSPSASASAGATASADRPDRETARAQRQDELAAALATELGLDKAKVAAALEKVQAARQSEVKADRIANLRTKLDAAVTAGTLTAEQRDAILKAAEAGVLPQGGFGGHGPGGGRPGR